MRSCAPLFASVFLCACASTKGPASLSAAPQTAPAVVNYSLANMAEVDAQAVLDEDVCRRETVVGSRIMRTRCFAVAGAEKDLLEAQTAFDIEFAREQALLNEQERLDEWARQGQRQQPFNP